MATYTSNYGWTKPSGSDQVNISVLNDNLDSQDSIMHDAFLNMAEPFSELSTYSVGDIVLYGTKTYKCRVAVTTAGSWTGATNWDEYKLSEGGSSTGGEVKNLDNGMLSHSTDSSYIIVNLDVALTAGKEYKITIRDPYYNYVDTKQIVWVPSVGVTFAGNGGGPYVISLTQTTVSLINYSGQGWRDIYCDIISDFETITAAQTAYDNTDSGLSATDVQEAVDELAEEKADKSDIAPEFNTTTAYAKGNLCYHEGTLYEFNQAHAAGAWNASHVDDVNIDSVLSDGFANIAVYTMLKEVTADGTKTYKKLINELFSDISFSIRSDYIISVDSAFRMYLMTGSSATKTFSSVSASTGSIVVRSITYKPSDTSATIYVGNTINNNGFTANDYSNVASTATNKLRLYMRSK